MSGTEGMASLLHHTACDSYAAAVISGCCMDKRQCLQGEDSCKT